LSAWAKETNADSAVNNRIFFVVEIIIISLKEARLAADLSDNLVTAYSGVWRI
jgi:hypothetical protein